MKNFYLLPKLETNTLFNRIENHTILVDGDGNHWEFHKNSDSLTGEYYLCGDTKKKVCLKQQSSENIIEIVLEYIDRKLMQVASQKAAALSVSQVSLLKEIKSENFFLSIPLEEGSESSVNSPNFLKNLIQCVKLPEEPMNLSEENFNYLKQISEFPDKRIVIDEIIRMLNNYDSRLIQELEKHLGMELDSDIAFNEEQILKRIADYLESVLGALNNNLRLRQEITKLEAQFNAKYQLLLPDILNCAKNETKKVNPSPNTLSYIRVANCILGLQTTNDSFFKVFAGIKVIDAANLNQLVQLLNKLIDYRNQLDLFSNNSEPIAHLFQLREQEVLQLLKDIVEDKKPDISSLSNKIDECTKVVAELNALKKSLNARVHNEPERGGKIAPALDNQDPNPLLLAAGNQFYDEGVGLAEQLLGQNELDHKSCALLSSTAKLVRQGIEDPATARIAASLETKAEAMNRNNQFKRLRCITLMVTGALACVSAVGLAAAGLIFSVKTAGFSLLGIPLSALLMEAGIKTIVSGLDGLKEMKNQKPLVRATNDVAKFFQPKPVANAQIEISIEPHGPQLANSGN